MTIWSSDYRSGNVCELANGLASVATLSGTSDVYFSRSFDNGLTWSAPVLVGTLASGKAAHIHQKTARQSARLIVTNGTDSVWQSDNMGRTWSAI